MMERRVEQQISFQLLRFGGLLDNAVMLVKFCQFAAIAFFPSERIQWPDKWMKYWYGGWICILLVCVILLMLYPDMLYGEDVF